MKTHNTFTKVFLTHTFCPNFCTKYLHLHITLLQLYLSFTLDLVLNPLQSFKWRAWEWWADEPIAEERSSLKTLTFYLVSNKVQRRYLKKINIQIETYLSLLLKWLTVVSKCRAMYTYIKSLSTTITNKKQVFFTAGTGVSVKDYVRQIEHRWHQSRVGGWCKKLPIHKTIIFLPWKEIHVFVPSSLALGRSRQNPALHLRDPGKIQISILEIQATLRKSCQHERTQQALLTSYHSNGEWRCSSQSTCTYLSISFVSTSPYWKEKRGFHIIN